ncbi:MAG: DeoR family transcriptional regulator [Candidatus Vogelbacteria bacterium]|nr:DeoR family transcriptional regulator [Candidatus Vogelbacteria bacterium]
MMEQKDNTIKDKINLFVLKNQKLAQALFAITVFCPDSEPLKAKLRDQAINLTTTINAIKTDESTVFHLSFLNQILGEIELVLELLDLAQAGNVLSKMNVSIIKQEYEMLLKDAKEQVLADNLFDSNTLILPTSSPKIIKDKKVVGMAGPSSDRQKKIIEVLRGQDWLGIKDIAEAVPNYSTKTVQRELLALVEQGVLKKQGERRWSRYVLAKAEPIAK